MIQKYSELSFLQKIAMYYYQKIDRTGAYYNVYSGFPRRGRVVLHVVYLFAIAIFVFSIKQYIHLQNYIEDKLMVDFLSSVGLCTAIIFCIYALFPLFYEFLFDKVDVIEVLKTKEDFIKQIKEKKKQWWRLRNINIFVRIVIYILLFSFSTTQALFFFLGNSPLAQRAEISKEDIPFEFWIIVSALILIFIVLENRISKQNSRK
jgi:hypothetical protein